MSTGTQRLGAATALILAGAIAGCGSDGGSTDAGGVDVGFDTGVDAGTPDVPRVDVGFDVGFDTGTPDVPTVDVPDVPAVDVPPSALPGAPVLLTRNASFSTPLTVALTASGATAYFTARTPAGAAALFRSGGAGAAPTAVAITGVPLVFPTGLAMSQDDNHIYIADQAASGNVGGVAAGEGALLSVGAEGGAATAINIGTLRRPRAVAVHGSPEQLTFIAVGANDNLPVIARVAATGGTVTVLAMGGTVAGVTSPLRNPSALAVGSDGTAYVTDGTADSGLGVVFRVVAGSAPARIAGRLRMGQPAGIALSRDGRKLLVAGWDVETGPGRLTWIGTDGMNAMSPAALGAPLTSPVGLGRARDADIFGIADDTATDTAAASWGGVFTAR